MRTICDVCESAPAILFCAADEAALCRSCDDKVHTCNKLASRHVRVSIANPSAVTRCDICENARAFFYCETDGSSLCLQCDMVVHVGGKRTHGRYLLLRQRVEFPGDKTSPFDDQTLQPTEPSEHKRVQNQVTQTAIAGGGPKERIQNNHWAADDANADHDKKTESKMIDLNTGQHRGHGRASDSGQKV